MVAYLAVRRGPEAGKQFPLDPSRPLHLGRGSNCEIMLTDPVSSRFHAVVYYEDGDWHVRDTSSRNGTKVNGQKTDLARLSQNCVIRIGETELQIVGEGESSLAGDNDMTIFEHPNHRQACAAGPADPIAAVSDSGLLIDLYALSIELLRCDDSEHVAATVLELLLDRTGSCLVGVSFDAGNGDLRPHLARPADHLDCIKISRGLHRRVISDGDAIWVAPSQDASSLGKRIDKRWTDAIYVPLDREGDNLGVLHLYRDQDEYDESSFEFAVTAGRLLAVGLRRGFESGSARAKNQSIAQRNAETDILVGESPPMLKLRERIERVGAANGSVLIRGESGTGKELVARAVHHCSRRAKRPMLSVNCAAIPRDLIESQLFGHKKGAFTGADNDHAGWFQQAHTGTLFLDEIGELPLAEQAKLLRVLEGHPFLPVGSSTEVLVDVRVIAATNRDLAEFVREKQFREDLFYRLSVFELVVPPLRERGDDIDRLIDHFLHHFRNANGRRNLDLAKDARRRLLEHPWPGNVRQLRNVLDSAVVMADDPAITVDDLGLRDVGVAEIDTLRIDMWERRLIIKALERTGGSVPKSAKLLGISRATAYRKIADYEIER